jgi:uncharacterized protein with ParB-like and HNH nuclease domain
MQNRRLIIPEFQRPYKWDNEYWKYPVSVFFLKSRTIAGFNENLCALLKKLIAVLFFKFIFSPSINAIRDDI